MWMRLDATTRRPASSSILVTAPVRLRRVASGLMIEKVRVTAIGLSFGGEWGFARAPSGGRPWAQGATIRSGTWLHCATLRIITAQGGSRGVAMIEPLRLRAGLALAVFLALSSPVPALGQEQAEPVAAEAPTGLI